MRRVVRTVLRGLLAASLLAVPAGPAAAVPEGCVGFPDLPEAWLCVTSFTPANAAPAAGTAGGTTFTVPAFCAFGQCAGPTPVFVPGVYVAQGAGAVATITYRGETYTVPVVQAPVVTLDLTYHAECFGCGPTSGTYAGTFTGVVDGHSFAAVPVSGEMSSNAGMGNGCHVSSSYEGPLVVSDGTSSATFTMRWAAVGAVVRLSLTGTTSWWGDGTQRRTAATSCGQPSAVTLSVVAQPIA